MLLQIIIAWGINTDGLMDAQAQTLPHVFARPHPPFRCNNIFIIYIWIYLNVSFSWEFLLKSFFLQDASIRQSWVWSAPWKCLIEKIWLNPCRCWCFAESWPTCWWVNLLFIIESETFCFLILHSIRWLWKNTPTLTVFKDTRYGIYITVFGMRLTRSSLAFDFYLTF